MGEITIKRMGLWCYDFDAFSDDIPIVPWKERERCYYCDTILHYIYGYIITSLRKAGLLSSAHTSLCCYCDTLLKLGLMELIDHCNTISYSPTEDILYIHIIQVDDEVDGIYLKIHDASKILKD